MSSAFEDLAQLQHAGRARLSAGAGGRHDGVARVEQHGAALLHVGVDAGQRFLRRARRGRHDRPVDQGEEGELVARRIDADGVAGFERGALCEEQRQALQAGLADGVHFGIARHDVGEPRFGRDLLGEIVGDRVGALALACWRLARSRRSPRREDLMRARAQSRRSRACGAASAGKDRRRARTPPARRSPASRARRGTTARAGPSARRADRPPCARRAARSRSG